jgi:acyl-CoA thioesterase YciA
MSDDYLALQVLMMPKDANPMPSAGLPENVSNLPYLTIFGGVILSYIDQAGAIGARREVVRRGGPPPFVVTVAINKVEFCRPVLVGDVVRFRARVVRLGRTSITMHVGVEVDRGQEIIQVTEAEVVYVGIDLSHPERRPLPLLPSGEGRTP